MQLIDFIKVKEKEVKQLKKKVPLTKLKEKIKTAPKVRDFKKAFKKNSLTLIAEIKKYSPSEGIINEKKDPVKIAKDYEKGGAGVVSVLTDKKYFHGDINSLLKVKNAISLPVLRKDFIIDEYQIYESRAYGADAILLIAGALSKHKLKRFLGLANSLGMECLIEIHNEREIKKIPNNARIVGINNRDLNTLKTDFSVIENLRYKIPKNKILISESGIKDRKDVQRIKKLKVNGILTGTCLMKQQNTEKAVRNLLL